MVVESVQVTSSKFGIVLRRGWVSVTSLCAVAVFGAAAPAEADPPPAGCTQAGTLVTCDYTTAGGPYSLTLPGDITTVSVDVIGARGGQGISGGPGGPGGAVSTDLAVAGGSTLFVHVGGNGGVGSFSGSGYGGVNGGGVGGFGGGGGGASDVRIGTDDLASRQVIAAGGGGGTSNIVAGGGPGQAGTGSAPGQGASTTSGGASGGGGSTAGTLGQGGNGATSGGGGGGGGLYGGGGGGQAGGGGGGSNSDGSNISSTDAARVTITYNVAAPAVAPTISGTPPAAVTGAPYNYAFTVTGTPAPTVAVTSGSLPAGLTLSADGVLSGTPTQTGTFPFTVTATNGTAPDTTLATSVPVTDGGCSGSLCTGSSLFGS